MKTPHVSQADITRNWFIVDASTLPLGRIATVAADTLRGKHRPTYSPHMDTGDGVIIINADNLVLTGRKLEQKFYARHTKYAGGFKVEFADKLKETNPEKIIHNAIAGMIPKNRLKREMLTRLRIFRGMEHDLQAQKPQPLFPSQA